MCPYFLKGRLDMKVGLYNLVSEVHNEEYIDSTLQGFLEDIEERLGEKFEKINLEDFSRKDYFPLIFIKSGGVEGNFKQIFKQVKGPYLLLSNGLHNSFAASLEIASFLKQKGKKVEIIHGSSEYIARRIKELRKILQVKNKLFSIKLGVIGKPSDWLIASEVDYNKIKETLGISLIDIGMDELVKEIDRDHNFNHPKLNDIKDRGFDSKSIDGALKIYNGFKAIVNKYKLDGITVRCFDLLEIYKNTGCLGLAFLNDEGIMGGCEGDIPALISMVILHYLTDEPVFMANPSSIDIDQKEIILAHCTLPLNMPDEFYLKTHFESGLGVGIQGAIGEGEATIFKLSGDGKKYFVSGGGIIENLNKESLCRTQIRMKVDEDIKYFLQNSLGNHHLICKGDYSEIVREFFKW
jgi:L-fucose isomerase-like protein